MAREEEEDNPHWGNVTPLKRPPKRLGGHVKARRATDAEQRAWAASIREALGWDQKDHDDDEDGKA